MARGTWRLRRPLDEVQISTGLDREERRAGAGASRAILRRLLSDFRAREPEVTELLLDVFETLRPHVLEERFGLELSDEQRSHIATELEHAAAFGELRLSETRRSAASVKPAVKEEAAATRKEPPKEARPAKEAATKVEPAKLSWITIVLVDEEGNPVAGEACEVTLPNGNVQSYVTDDKGTVHFTEIDPGTCRVCFTNLDEEAWERIPK
jgi:hypothetical protein